MNDLTVFQNPDFGQVRTIVRDGEPWFVAADVCRALEIDRTQIRRLDEDEKGVYSMQTPRWRTENDHRQRTRPVFPCSWFPQA